ncbi:hypothetical protein Ciccas_010716 [Cichlidogyrus casuarinus]|uniref:Mitochondrial inner membrane protein Mpv17 n=1 Tax=Cichlidogyrus casuarinus TaxID=1844966 RepID=A0ABD2PTB2_9PLAT
MCSGDLLAQKVVERKKRYDVKRGLTFWAIGTFFLGPIACKWYYTLESVYSQSKGIQKVGKMVLTDQAIFAPFALSTTMGIVGFVQSNGDLASVKNKMDSNFISVLCDNYKFWPFVQIINFNFVPIHLRLMFANSVAVIWNTYLSWRIN